MTGSSLWRRLLAEFLGSAFLAAVVIGSGIAAQRLPAQVAGCTAGAVVANLMFGRAAVSISATHRATPAHLLAEVVATLGLVLVIFALARSGRARTAPAAVGAYIGAAYFFTSSTGFANPAITIGRMFSATFARIAPSSGPAFISAQVVGGLLAIGVIKALYPGVTRRQRRRSPSLATRITPPATDRPTPRPGRERAWTSPRSSPGR